MGLKVLVTNDYETWDLSLGWTLASGGTVIHAKQEGEGFLNVTAEKGFDLSSVPTRLCLSVKAEAACGIDSSITLQVTVTRPDEETWVRSVSLFTYESFSGWLVDGQDIASFCTETGTYTLKLEASMNVERSEGMASVSYMDVALVLDTPPANLEVTQVTQTSVSLDWDDDEEATSYNVYWRTGTDEWSSQSVTDSNYTITSLERGTEYELRVTSVNDIGESSPAEESAQTEEAAVQEVVETLTLAESSWRVRGRVLTEHLSVTSTPSTMKVEEAGESKRVIVAGTSEGDVVYFAPVYDKVVEITTPVFDFGSTDTTKVLSHITVRGDPPTPVGVSIYGSRDHGLNWMFLGSGILQRGAPLVMYTWMAGSSFMLKLVGEGLYVQGIQAATAEGGRT